MMGHREECTPVPDMEALGDLMMGPAVNNDQACHQALVPAKED